MDSQTGLEPSQAWGFKPFLRTSQDPNAYLSELRVSQTSGKIYGSGYSNSFGRAEVVRYAPDGKQPTVIDDACDQCGIESVDVNAAVGARLRIYRGKSLSEVRVTRNDGTTWTLSQSSSLPLRFARTLFDPQGHIVIAGTATSDFNLNGQSFQRDGIFLEYDVNGIVLWGWISPGSAPVPRVQ